MVSSLSRGQTQFEWGGVLLWQLGRHQHPLYARTPPVFSIWHTSGKMKRQNGIFPFSRMLLPLVLVIQSGPPSVGLQKKYIYISIKTYKPCPNPLKQLKTTPSSLQHYWSSCCMLCGRFLSIMADKKNYLFSAFSQDELRIFHSSLQSDYPDKGESASGGIFCGAKKTMFAKFKTGTDLFQPSWSVLTFWFEAWSLQLCPITTLNHTYVVNTNWLIKQTPQ